MRLESDFSTRVVHGGAELDFTFNGRACGAHLDGTLPSPDLERGLVAHDRVMAVRMKSHLRRDEACAPDGSRDLFQRELLTPFRRDGDEIRLKVDSNVVNAIQALEGVLDAPPSRASLESLGEDRDLDEPGVLGENGASVACRRGRDKAGDGQAEEGEDDGDEMLHAGPF
jgi:hypothetical protein